MKKSSIVTTVLMLLLVVSFSSPAQATGLRIMIQEIQAGNVTGVVISDGTPGLDGDGDPATGSIFFSGTVGGFVVTTTLAQSNAPGIGGMGILSVVDTQVVWAPDADINSGASLRLTVLDDSYDTFPGSSYFYSTVDVTQTGANTTGQYQAWVGFNGSDPNPDFGPDGTFNDFVDLVLPAANQAAYLTMGTAWGTMINSSGATTSPVHDVSGQFPGSTYKLFSQAEITLDSDVSASANFTLTNIVQDSPPLQSHPVPEPASLVLLLSGLGGITLLRTRKGRAS
jgi:hypothetical protein